MKELIYLDHNATTMIDPQVIKAMESFMNTFGNPSSSHVLGKEAKDALEKARQDVAELIGAQASEIVFTSGGTESNNTVIKGIVDLKEPEKNHIIISAIEHPSILNPASYLMELGVEVSIVKVSRNCLIDPEDVKKEIRPNTKLISIMLANNETGTIQPIKEIAQIGKEFGIPVHTDAAQAVGKIPVNVTELGIDLLTIAGHKLYAPKGIGALFIKKGVKITPLLHGGGQEEGRRSGTENVIMAVALGTACKLAKNRLKEDISHIKKLRDKLQKLLFQHIEGIVLNGDPEKRLPNTLNISVPGIPGEKILEKIPQLIASTGSACHEGKNKISHVLSAMGVPEEVAIGALRLSLGRSNTEEQINTAAELIISCIKELRNGHTSFLNNRYGEG